MTPAWTFDPQYLQIQAGDIVTWTNADPSDAHDSASTQGYWDSGQLAYGQTYSLFFPATGAFSYGDTFYAQAGMTGAIIVEPATEPPPAALVNPVCLPNQTFQFTVTNLIFGETNIIQASTNLLAWTSLYTNIATSTGYTFVDTGPVLARRFYRVQARP